MRLRKLCDLPSLSPAVKVVGDGCEPTVWSMMNMLEQYYLQGFMLCGCRFALYMYANQSRYRFRHAQTSERAEPRNDLSDAFPASHAPIVRATSACDTRYLAAVPAALMPLLLDPVKFLGKESAPVVLSFTCRYVAANLVRVGTMPGRMSPEPSRLDLLDLPLPLRMTQRSLHGAADPGFDDGLTMKCCSDRETTSPLQGPEPATARAPGCAVRFSRS